MIASIMKEADEKRSLFFYFFKNKICCHYLGAESRSAKCSV